MQRRPGDRRIHGLSPRDDVERELAFHLAMRERELIEAGWTAAAARTEARRLFGDYDAIRAECGEVAVRSARSRRRWRMLGELAQDLRYAGRWLAREKGFAVLAVVTLALGIGANSAAFAIVDGVLLRPLPYPSPDRLAAVWQLNEDGYEVPLAWPNFEDWRRAELRTVARLTAYQEVLTISVLGGVEPVRARVARVSGDFFDVLGVAPLHGRAFLPDELVPGGRAAVLVSESFWREQLDGARDLSALRLELFGAAAQVVGVMPGGFDHPRGAQLWYPLDPEADALGTRSSHNFRGLARLSPGATVASAQAELSALAAGIRLDHPESSAVAVVLRPLHEQSVGGARRALLILLGASGCVLLVACTNLASALLARTARRRSELAVRAALGARRSRLMRQLLTESVLLAAVGAAAGLLLAWLLVDALRALGPDAVPRLAEVRLDHRVLAFTTVIALLTGIVFGTVPALRATAADPFGTLRASGRGTDSSAQRRAWGVLISAEVALALLLLVASGLMIRSFWNVMRIDPGFDVDRVAAVDIALPPLRYPDRAARAQYYDALRERTARLPSVEQVAVTMALPLTGWDPNGRFQIEGGADGDAHYRVVSPGFFEALRIPLRAGRVFDERDRAGALDVIVINAALADRYLPGQDPIGRRISTGGMDAQGDVYATIVGVVENVRHHDLTTPPEPGYYLPYMQRSGRMATASLLVRTTGRPGPAMGSIRTAVRELDADVPVEVTTLRERVGERLADRRFMLLVLGGFAAVALLLAAVGIYAVVAFAVAQRTREIGIRMALGAGASRVVWQISRATMASVLVGLIVGLIAAALLARLTATLLFGMEAVDPLTFAGVAAVLLATAGLAALVPARRALRVSPSTALRAE